MRANFKLSYLVGVIVVSFGLSLPLIARFSAHLAAKTPVTSTVTIDKAKFSLNATEQAIEIKLIY